MRAAVAATSMNDFRVSALRHAIIALVAVKVVGLVLVFDPQGLQSFDFPKSLFSRAVSWLIAACIVIGLVRYGPSILPRTRLHLFVGGFVLLAVAAALGSPSPYVALYGDQDSYLGLTFVADMLVLYLATAIAFRDASDALALAAPLAAASVLVLLYGAVQRAGLDPIRWTEDPRTRPFSTFGHPDDFGFALSLLVAAAAAVAASPRAVVAARLGAAALAVAALAMAAEVATRGTVLGVAAAILAIAFARTRSGGWRAPRLAASFALVVVSLAALLALTPLGARVRGAVADAPIADRALLYASAVAAIADRPLLGYGPDGFALAYPAHRVPAGASILGPGRPQVSAHDWILQAAVSYGSLGVAALLLLVGAGTVAIVRALRRRPTLGAVLLAVWCAYWTQALVTVGSISVDWVPWLTLGIAASITGRHARQLSPHRPARTLAIAAFVAATVLALSGAAAFAANRDALLTESADAATALRAAERAVARDPGRAMYWNRLGLARERGGDPAGAAVAYHEAARRAPYRATYWDNVAWSRLGAGDAAAAVEAADSAVSVDPFDPFSLYAAAEARRAAGDCDGALSAAAGAMAIYHDGPGFSRSLARAALCSSDPGHARSVLEQAVRWDSAELHAALADLLYAGGDVERARQHATRALEIDPKNAVALTVLSALAASR